MIYSLYINNKKKIGKSVCALALTLLASTGMTSCLDETNPSTYITAEQMAQSESSLAGQNVAMAASVMNYGSSYSHAAYPALMIWRDVHCAELPIYATTYDYFGNTTQYMGEGQLYYDWWYQYFNTIHNANVLIGMVDADAAQEQTLVYLGNALGYRAWCYLEASQLWEYKKTGVSTLDQIADNNGIWGLTVPIVDENITKDQSRNNERAPFWKMFRFIHNDLTLAEKYLSGYKRSQVNEMNTASVCALMARFWLMAASRFEQSSEDLSIVLSHENDADGYAPLGISSANECFAKAAEYAQKAIDASGLPTSQSQWMDPDKGFCSAIQSWIFGIEMVPDDNKGESWKSFASFMSPEATFGVCNPTYESLRLCDQALYDGIEDADWRKMTWISPDDVGTADAVSKYATKLTGSSFEKLPELCGLKFHVNYSGSIDYSSSGSIDHKAAGAIDLPIIRVEEMYYILAEAKAHSESLAEGISVLEQFTNTWRYTDGSYVCTAADMDAFVREIIRQKRIEFWGEGIVYWDYKRLALGVSRKYEGSNHPSSYQHNSPDGVVARWWNFYIPSNEYQYNKAIKQNPDPSHTADMEY